MLLVSFITWWYGPGWLGAVRKSRYYLRELSRNFSVPVLLRTLFAPWKQIDAFAGVNLSIGDRFRRWIDRFVSRLVGFGVRSLTLMAALISLSGLLLARLVWVAVWPLLPLVVPAALLYSLGVF